MRQHRRTRIAISKIIGRICLIVQFCKAYSYQKRHRQGINSRSRRNIQYTPSTQSIHGSQIPCGTSWCLLLGTQSRQKEGRAFWALPEGYWMTWPVRYLPERTFRPLHRRTNEQKPQEVMILSQRTITMADDAHLL